MVLWDQARSMWKIKYFFTQVKILLVVVVKIVLVKVVKK